MGVTILGKADQWAAFEPGRLDRLYIGRSEAEALGLFVMANLHRFGGPNIQVGDLELPKGTIAVVREFLSTHSAA